ncbi:hypothetical protein Tco_1210451 [Tanacetum coccineum]
MPLDCQLGIVAMWGEWEGFVKWLMECCRVEVWEQNRVLAGFGIGGKIGKRGVTNSYQSTGYRELGPGAVPAFTTLSNRFARIESRDEIPLRDIRVSHILPSLPHTYSPIFRRRSGEILANAGHAPVTTAHHRRSIRSGTPSQQPTSSLSSPPPPNITPAATTITTTTFVPPSTTAPPLTTSSSPSLRNAPQPPRHHRHTTDATNNIITLATISTLSPTSLPLPPPAITPNGAFGLTDHPQGCLMLLVQKLLLLVFKVNAAGIKVTTTERLQLLEEFMLTEKRSKTYQRKNKD